MESFKNKMLSEMSRPNTDLDDAKRSPEETQELINTMRKKYGITINPMTKKAEVKDTPALRTGFRSAISALIKRQIKDDFERPTFKSESVERLDEIVGALGRLAGGLVGRSAAKTTAGAAATKAATVPASQVASVSAKMKAIGARRGLPTTMAARNQLAANLARVERTQAAAAARAAAAPAARGAAVQARGAAMPGNKLRSAMKGIDPANVKRLRLMKQAQSKGLMDASGKLTGLGYAKGFVGGKVKGIADPNLRGLATRAMEGGFGAANVARQSLSGLSMKSAAGSLAKTAMRNPLTTMAVGSMVANRMRNRQQPATGGY